MNFLEPSPDLAARFHAFTRGLYQAIAKYTVEHRSSHPLIGVICKRLTRRAVRFAALVARFHAGTLPPPRSEASASSGSAPSDRAQSGCATPGDATVGQVKLARAPDPVPRCRAYLLQLGKHEAAFYMNCLETLIADPYMLELLRASPQACRLLRPLWRMLNPRPLPDVLRLPPRRPSAAPSAPVAARQGATTSTPSNAYAKPPRVRRSRPRGVRRFGTGPLIRRRLARRLHVYFVALSQRKRAARQLRRRLDRGAFWREPSVTAAPTATNPTAVGRSQAGRRSTGAQR